MFQSIRIAPSILSADFMHLGRDIDTIAEAGAGFVHIDVMDGHFVPNLTMGVPVVKQCKRATDVLLDVHLMIDNPLYQLPWFLDAGADIVTMHAEVMSDEDMAEGVRQIHDAGAKAAIAIKPRTSVAVLENILPELDMVLIMSVEPGFSGQSYIEGSEGKVAELVRLCRECGTEPLIEVDGGIKRGTAAKVAEAGADVLVCGNAVFGASDIASALRDIQYEAECARQRGVRNG